MADLHIVPHQYKVAKADRNTQKGHLSKVIWFTGLSGSGKSTIANVLEQRLVAKGFNTYLLDGDNVRMGLNKGLTFSSEDRQENIRRIGEVAKLFVDAGTIVITAFISPFASDRQMARDLLEEGEFVEVFVNCPLEECERRDVKGLYKKARKGIIKNFTGIDSPFEEPQSPELSIKSHEHSVEECVEQVLAFLLPKLELEKADQ